MLKQYSLFLGLAVFLSSTIFAQSSGVGTISGVVTDASGATVPGAKVLVENPSKGIRREVDTTSSGAFTVPALVPASGYRVVINKQGFAAYEIKGLTVQVGESITLTPTLGVAAAAAIVEVTDQAPLLDSSKVDVSELVSSKQILELPINGRRVDAFVLLTPGVTTDGPFGLISFRGNAGGNSFLTDGNDTTNQFYNENAGRTRTTNISQDAVQEFQVITSNFLAEYGRASGGVINTVTRSGGNDLHGTAYWFFRNRTLNATDTTTRGINPPEWRHQAGASIGGPIIKDKLFYFFNGELQRRSAPLVSSNLTNGALFDTAGNFRSTVCTLPATPAQCAVANAFIVSRTQRQLVPRTMDTNLMFAKLDYRPSDRSSFSFSHNFMDFRSPNGIQTQLSFTDGAGVGNNADTNVFNRTARASWTYVVTPTGVNEFRFGFFKDRQYDPASPSLLPATGPVTLTVQGTGNIGYPNGYPRLNPSENRFQLVDTFSKVSGKHSMKAGIEWAHVEDYVERLANRFGTYTYATLSAFAQDFGGGGSGKNWQTYTQAFGNPVISIKIWEMGWFLQDQWRVTSKLTITPGIRFEYTHIPQPKISNPAFPQTSRIPTDHAANFAPRFGIAYALNSKTNFRAGYGLFYNRYTTSTIQNLQLTNGVYQANYALVAATAGQLAAGPVFPNRLSAAPNVTGASTIVFADKNWRNPYSQQMDVAIEREVARNTSLSTSYVWSRGLHLLQTRDSNAAEPTTSATFPILDSNNSQVGSYTTPLYTQRINPAFGFVGQFESTGNSYYNGLIVSLKRRYSNWLQGSLAYTWSHALDYNQGGGGNTLFGSSFPTSVFNGNYRNEKGGSSTDQRQRLVINAILAPTFIKSTSGFARHVVNGWQLSVVTVAASAQRLTPNIRVQNAAPGTLQTTSLNGLGGSNRVPFVDPDALPIQDLYRTDARITKTIPIGEKLKVSLMFEAFNAFNRVIIAGSGARVTQQYTSIRQTSGPLNGQIALVPNPTYGAIGATQSSPDGTTARRAQVALRFVF